MTSQEIRQQFLDFFIKKHGHTFVPSSPVVPLDDPTLLFTNAGMNQFKPIFLGQEKREYTRAANTQKCIRAGGKHNDLDDVGRSRRHGTFFEMLGNWSFGDYFKEGAIEMSWELITQVFKLDPTRIHATCYIGDEKSGIPRDTEAAEIWRKVANWEQYGEKSDDHIHFLAENFWEMGDTGPCGPCTEIFYDNTPNKTGGPSIIKDDDPRVMEFWNNVFIQYNRDANGKLTPLPAQHVDTGLGFERICSILQNKTDMYGIDLFDPFFAAISNLCGFKYTGEFPKTNAPDPVAEAANPQLRRDIAFRVIADHLRTLTFALTDGAVPSNEGRGYVLRRILRRAVRFGRQQLDLNEPFLHTLVPVIVDAMGGAFPELKKNPQHVIELIRDEEVSFGRTLDRGIQLFEDAANTSGKSFLAEERVRRAKDENAKADFLGWQGSQRMRLGLGTAYFESRGFIWQDFPGTLRPVVSADSAFKLHDTYGFPIDLTRIMAEERGMTVDIAGYEKLMEEAKELARSGGKTDEGKKLTELPPAAFAQLTQANVKPTDDQPKFNHDAIQSKVMAIWNGDDLGLSLADAFEDEQLAVILDRTNFYAEMGGQVGDTGVLSSSAAQFDVETTKTVANYTLHIGRVRSGKIKAGDIVTATVAKRRIDTEKNHTTTHLANWALRETLGDGVQQKGSLVDPEKLRFDFSHGKSMTDEELARVEELVNTSIAACHTVHAEEVPQEQALKINGLRAVFGEKYPPKVRVVSIGVPVQELLKNPTNPDWRKYSIEFCGGTHLFASGDATVFTITAEESVSKGIRRIVGLTGKQAHVAVSAAKQLDALIAQSKSAADADLPPLIANLNQAISAGTLPLRAKRRVQATIAELQARHKAFEKSHKSQPAAGGPDPIAAAAQLLAAAPTLGPGKLIIGEISGATDDQLRSAIDSLKTKSPSYAILLAAANGEKVTFIAAVSDDLIAKGLKAGDWVKETAKIAGGSGGGRPNMAQAGAKDPTKLSDALAAGRAYALKSA